MAEVRNNPAANAPLSVAIKATGRFAGRARMYKVFTAENCWELEILIAQKFQGQRLGREAVSLLMDAAFVNLGAESVVATVDPANAPSRKLFNALGFGHIGTKQSADWNNGHLILQRLRGDAVQGGGRHR
jgi:RimJ/RimL family protein N-acetyltransferase